MSMRNHDIPSDAVAITPSDTTFVDLMGIYVGTTGNVAVLTAGGSTTTFTAVPAGGIIPLRIVKVMSTNTTASTIVGFKA